MKAGTDYFMVVVTCLGCLVGVVLLAVLALDLHARARAEENQGDDNAPQAGRGWLFAIGILGGLALVHLLFNLPDLAAMWILPAGVMAAFFFHLDNQPRAAWRLPGGLLAAGGALLLALTYDWFLGPVPTNPPEDLSRLLFHPGAARAVLIAAGLFLCYAVCQGRPAPTLPVVMVGGTAGLAAALLLASPFANWASRSCAPGNPSPAASSIQDFGCLLLAAAVLLAAAPAAAAWAAPGSRAGRFALGAACGALAAGLLFCLLGAPAAAVLTQSKLAALAFAPPVHPSAAWGYQYSLAISRQQPAIYAGLWASALVGALWGGCTGLLAGINDRAAPPRPAAWPLGLFAVGVPWLQLLAAANLLVMSLYDPAVTLAQAVYGAPDPWVPSQGLVTAIAQPAALAILLQAGGLAWLRFMPADERLRRMTGALFFLVGVLNLAWVVLLAVSYPQQTFMVEWLLLLPAAELLAVSWRLGIGRQFRHNTAGTRAVSGWVSGGMLASLAAGLLAAQLLSIYLNLANYALALAPYALDGKQLAGGRFQEILQDFLFTSLAASCLLLAAAGIVGAAHGWLLKQWQRGGWLLGLWAGGAPAARPGASRRAQRLLAGLGGLLLGVLVSARQSVSAGELALAGMICLLALIPPRVNLRRPRLALGLASALGAAGFMALTFSPPYRPDLDSPWLRAACALLVGPAWGLVLWAAGQPLPPSLRPALRLAQVTGMLVVFVLLVQQQAPVSQFTGGVSVYDGAAWQRLALPGVTLGEHISFGFFTDSRGVLWAGSGGGLVLEQRPEGWHAYPLDHADPDMPAARLQPAHFAETPNGQVWAALGRQLELLDPAAGDQQAVVIEPRPLGGSTPADPCPVSALEWDAGGQLWAATCGEGVYRLELTAPPDKQYWSRLQGKESGLAADQVNTLLRDPRGELWLATGAGLSRCGAQSCAPLPAPGLEDAPVYALLLDGQGAVWAGARGGGARWDGAAWTPFGAWPGWPEEAGVAALFADSRGGLWAGTGRGAYRLAEGRWQPVVEALEVTAFAEGPPGVVWTGGAQGLARCDLQTGLQQRFTTENSSMPVNRVVDLRVDRRGRLWVSNAGGQCSSRPPLPAMAVSAALFGAFYLWALRGAAPQRTDPAPGNA